MKKYILGAAMLVAVYASPLLAQAQTTGLTTGQINAIMSLLQAFNADQSVIDRVNIALSGGTPTQGQSFCYKFNIDLAVGSTGPDIAAINQALSSLGIDTTGNTSTYSENTAGDVVMFQARYGIRQTGYVGPQTRAKLNSLYGCRNNQHPILPTTPIPATAPTSQAYPTTQPAPQSPPMTTVSSSTQPMQTVPPVSTIQTAPPMYPSQSVGQSSPTQPTQPMTMTPVSPVISATSIPDAPAPAPTSMTELTPTTLLTDNFNSYTSGTLLGQGGWQNYSNGQNFLIKSASSPEGSAVVYNNSTADSIITKTGASVADGQQSLYVRTENRSNWAEYADGNAQVRISQGQAFVSSIFAAVSFKKDGNVAYYDPKKDTYQNFATYNDNEWTLLEIQWQSSDKTARYRINGGSWTDWSTFNGAPSFTGFDSVGFDFVLLGGSGGVYYDNLH